MIEIAVTSKYGPAIQREPGRRRYLCLNYPCPNSTRLFYRPANSNLCPACIRAKYLPKRAAAQSQG